MNFRRDIWTYLLVTFVTVLIWFWAAGETRDTKKFSALVEFTVPESSNWIVKPQQQSITIELEGAQLALQRARTLLDAPLMVSVNAAPGPQTIDLTERLRLHDDLKRIALSVVEVTPSYCITELDQIDRVEVAIKPTLPGVMTDGEIVVDPREATVTIPSQLRQRLGNALTVEAVIDRPELDRLAPGVPHTQEARLRLPEILGPMNDVTISPSRAKLTFTIRSRTREHKLATVRVQITGPPEGRDRYKVELEPSQLQNVTITADIDLVRRIQSQDENERATVVAMLHLGLREMERGITSKRITTFMALLPDGSATQVVARVNDSPEMPVIQLRITERQQPAPDGSQLPPASP